MNRDCFPFVLRICSRSIKNLRQECESLSCLRRSTVNSLFKKKISLRAIVKSLIYKVELGIRNPQMSCSYDPSAGRTTNINRRIISRDQIDTAGLYQINILYSCKIPDYMLRYIISFIIFLRIKSTRVSSGIKSIHPDRTNIQLIVSIILTKIKNY